MSDTDFKWGFLCGAFVAGVVSGFTVYGIDVINGPDVEAVRVFEIDEGPNQGLKAMRLYAEESADQILVEVAEDRGMYRTLDEHLDTIPKRIRGFESDLDRDIEEARVKKSVYWHQ